jgi:hypothetical protein
VRKEGFGFCGHLRQRREGLQQSLGVIGGGQLCDQGGGGGGRLVIVPPAKLPAVVRLGLRCQ